MNKEYQVMVPCNERKNVVISYPMSGSPLYTKAEAVKVMEAFGRKCAARIEVGNRLEVWAKKPGCQFTLADYRDDFCGVRTEDR